MKSAVSILILWFSFSKALNQVSSNTSKDLLENLNNTRTDCSGYCFSAMQTFLVNLVTLEHANNTQDNVNITENIMASTITDLQTLLQNKDRQIYLNNEQYLKFINMLRENISLKNQENIRLQNILENLTNHRCKDGQIQDNNEQVRVKDIQKNSQNYEIKDLIEQINSKQENQEIIRLQHRLENLTETITNYRIETALKDSQIQDFIEQLKAKDAQINTKDNEIKDLRDQIKSTESISKKLNLTNDELATYKYTEQCPNFNTTTFFQFKIRGINKFQARCAPSGWMVIQNRYDGRENFSRSWNEYKEGFGMLRTEFFFGLEKLHMMTAARTYELHILLKDSNGSTSYAHYSDFKIGSEEESYRLKSLGKYSGTAGSSLDYHIQSNFSTCDRDFLSGNDWKGCVINHGGGWWYKDCGLSSLNGYYFKETKSEPKDMYSIYWEGFRGCDSNITLTETLMKIRPTSL